jgi:hypothetical protein
MYAGSTKDPFAIMAVQLNFLTFWSIFLHQPNVEQGCIPMAGTLWSSIQVILVGMLGQRPLNRKK